MYFHIVPTSPSSEPEATKYEVTIAEMIVPMNAVGLKESVERFALANDVILVGRQRMLGSSEVNFSASLDMMLCASAMSPGAMLNL